MVYFVQCQDSGAIKIGYTGRSIPKRMAELLACRGKRRAELQLLGSIDGSKSTEREMHARWATWRMRSRHPLFGGEAFYPSDELLSFLSSLPKQPKFVMTKAPIKPWGRRVVSSKRGELSL